MLIWQLIRIQILFSINTSLIAHCYRVKLIFTEDGTILPIFHLYSWKLFFNILPFYSRNIIWILFFNVVYDKNKLFRLDFFPLIHPLRNMFVRSQLCRMHIVWYYYAKMPLSSKGCILFILPHWPTTISNTSTPHQKPHDAKHCQESLLLKPCHNGNNLVK